MVDVDNIYIHEVLNDLQQKIESFGNLARVEDKNIIRWGKQITEERFKLIPNLVRILNDTTSYDEKQNIILVMKYLLQLNSDVKNQLIIEEDLPENLINFIITSNKEKKKLDLNAIFILAFVYLTYKYSNFVLNIDLVQALFDSLKIIDEEIVLERIIMILIDINSQYKKNEENNFLKIYHEHESSILIDEIILRLYNKISNKEKMFKILLCVINIMDKEKKIVFYLSDLETFIDISILKLISTYSDELRCFILEILDRITRSPEYFENMYKLNDLTKLTEEICINENLGDAVIDIASKVNRNLRINVENQIRIKAGLLPKGFDEDDEEEEYEEGEEEEDEGEGKGEDVEGEDGGQGNDEEEGEEENDDQIFFLIFKIWFILIFIYLKI